MSKKVIPNLYHILGLKQSVCEKPECDKIIHSAYTKRALVCHPDKNIGRDDAQEFFELLTSAYDILKNKESRDAYNIKLRRSVVPDHTTLRDRSTKFSETYRPLRIDEEEFKKAIQATPKTDDPRIAAEVKDSLAQLQSRRARQDVDLMPKRMFEEGKFDARMFNAMCDKKGKVNEGSVIKHTLPEAWNNGSGLFGAFDSNNLEGEAASWLNPFGSSQVFTPIDFNKPIENDIDLVDLDNASYFDSHNVLGEDYYKDIKSRLAQRQADTERIEKLKHEEYRTDDAGYGKVFSEIEEQLLLSYDDDVMERYNTLLTNRKTN